jgi:hypothetical protein
LLSFSCLILSGNFPLICLFFWYLKGRILKFLLFCFLFSFHFISFTFFYLFIFLTIFEKVESNTVPFFDILEYLFVLLTVIKFTIIYIETFHIKVKIWYCRIFVHIKASVDFFRLYFIFFDK